MLKRLPKLSEFALAISVLIAFFWFFYLHRYFQRVEPDYYYHIAVSKMIAEQGLLRTLPQAVGIGWDSFFPDKEFLFHVLTGAAFKLGGEAAVPWIPRILNIATLLVLVRIFLRYVPAALAAVSAAMIFLTPGFLFREVMLRPHTLAILLFVLLLDALLRGNRRWSLVWGICFALGYHGIYVPAAILGVSFYVHGNWKEWKKSPAVWGLAGILIGTVANPYFPGNLLMGAQHLFIALEQSGGAKLPYGGEIFPQATNSFLSNYIAALVAFALCLSQFGRVTSKDRPVEFRFVLFSAALFWGLAALTPRSIEYAVPLTAVLLAILLARFGFEPMKKNWMKWAALGVAAGAAIYFHHRSYIDVSPKKEDLRQRQELFEALKRIPKEDAGSLVFTCQWELGSLVLYARPDLKFLDLLDPSFLAKASPESLALREEFVSGKTADPYGLLKNFFKAKYMLCPGADFGLESDFRFKRISPVGTPKAGDTFLYQVLDHPKPVLANHYDGVILPPLAPGEIRKLAPDRSLGWKPVQLGGSGGELGQIEFPYVDLAKWAKAQAKVEGLEEIKGKNRCYWIRPAASEVARHAGAELLGIGGGPNQRVWWNGQRFFQSLGESPSPRVLSIFLPLPRPLRIGDQIEVLVCDSVNQYPNMGLALSFWQRQEIDEVCAERESPNLLGRKDRGEWPYLGAVYSTCLAPVALSTQSGK